MGFSDEDNCCQLQGIGKLIKEKLSKGILKSCLKVLGAAYTRVRLIHKSLRYIITWLAP